LLNEKRVKILFDREISLEEKLSYLTFAKIYLKTSIKKLQCISVLEYIAVNESDGLALVSDTMAFNRNL